MLGELGVLLYEGKRNDSDVCLTGSDCGDVLSAIRFFIDNLYVNSSLSSFVSPSPKNPTVYSVECYAIHEQR